MLNQRMLFFRQMINRPQPHWTSKDIKRFRIPDGRISLAGLDGPGDATAPAVAIARWIAYSRGAQQAEIADFLTCIHILFADEISRYWPDGEKSRLYLRRENVPDLPRESLIREAWQWLTAGLVYGRGPIIAGRQSLASGRIRSEASSASVTVSKSLDALLIKSREIAVASGRAIVSRSFGPVGVPSIECVLLCLLDDSEFSESDRLKESGINGSALRRAVKEL